MFGELMHLIGENIQHDTRRNHAIPSSMQILITLRFLATGTFQAVIGDLVNIHKSSVCRIIKRVCNEIAKLRRNFIQMPSTIEEIQQTKVGFYKMHKFPQVIGVIDCTHIRIQSPCRDIGEQYRNRKGYFSFNVQAVCNSNLEITDIVARWPGSVHDSTIFDNSSLRAKLENNEFGDCYILGDGGYPCRRYLMTPLLNPLTASEKKYQKSQIGTRNIIERVFGILKRFPALGIRTKLTTTMAIIVAAAVLHNMLRIHNDPMPQDDHDEIDPEIFHELPVLPARQVGNVYRTHLINTIFSSDD